MNTIEQAKSQAELWYEKYEDTIEEELREESVEPGPGEPGSFGGYVEYETSDDTHYRHAFYAFDDASILWVQIEGWHDSTEATPYATPMDFVNALAERGLTVTVQEGRHLHQEVRRFPIAPKLFPVLTQMGQSALEAAQEIVENLRCLNDMPTKTMIKALAAIS
jgi:hypothetical protein